MLMKTARIMDILPQCYANFLPPFFSSRIPIESAATCSNCAMLENPGSHSHTSIFFSADTKCCTHHPELPNYLVGALLGATVSKNETGRRRITDKIAARTGITPLGVLRPKKYTLLIKNSAIDYFGRSKALLCPFYESSSGLCTIAPHWDGVCSTWFCKHGAGEDGKKFWRTLRKYLENLEKILTRYALLKIGANPSVAGLIVDESTPLTVRELDDLPPPDSAYEALWGKWAGKEEEFYRECYTHIKQLEQGDFANLEGIGQKILLRELEQAYDQLNAPLPALLKKNPALSAEKISDSAYLLAGYSPFDPSRASKRLYDCLDFFDGTNTNEEACRLCHETYKVRLTGAILKKLNQFRILVSLS